MAYYSLLSSFALVIVCLFLPPAAVFLVEGGFGEDFGINVVFTFLGWLPGVLHALTIIFAAQNLRIDHGRQRTHKKQVRFRRKLHDVTVPNMHASRKVCAESREHNAQRLRTGGKIQRRRRRPTPYPTDRNLDVEGTNYVPLPTIREGEPKSALKFRS